MWIKLQGAYMAAIPELSLENTDVKVYTSDARREMEEKINILEKENESLKEENQKATKALWDEINSMKARQDAWEQIKKGE